MCILNKQQLKISLICIFLSIVSSCTSYTLEEDKASHVSLTQTSLAQAELNQAKFNQKSLEKNDLLKNVPVIKIFDAQENFNKIGTPKANADGSVYVDSNEASFYTTEQVFSVDERQYTNLIYRVHFSEIPFSIIPFHLSKGKNVGLIFVVTLNDKKEPVLFTAVHTCGCYKALMATSFTPESFYPDYFYSDSKSTENRKLKEKQKVYGEKLPTIIALNDKQPDICVAIRPQEHRVMDVYACDKTQNNFVEAQHHPLESLRTLPSENGTVSFFHESGIQEGFVKGAIKPWESLMLSWPSMDFFVGTDKALLRPESSDNTFYTSLKPWNRDKSDMANFPQFVSFWGWKL